MGDKAAAWPGVQVLDGKCCCCLAWVPFLQITFHAGCRHTHFWQGVAWMVRPICAHRARYRKLIVWLLDIYILEACAVIFRKAIVMLPEANFLSPWCESPSSRAQNRHFCALSAFGAPVFGHFEHKIEVFVRFYPSKPLFSGLSSTKRAFLCQKGQFSPGFRPSRAQNRVFCTREE